VKVIKAGRKLRHALAQGVRTRDPRRRKPAQLDCRVRWFRGAAGQPGKRLFRPIFPALGSSRTSSTPDPSLLGSSVHALINVLPHSD
jgi:hypothetical protein